MTETTTTDRAKRPPHMSPVKIAAQIPRSRLTAVFFFFSV